MSAPSLDRKAVHRLPVVVPNRELIQQFDDVVEPMFAMIQTLTVQTQKLRTARDLLLPRLMSGEIAV